MRIAFNPPDSQFGFHAWRAKFAELPAISSPRSAAAPLLAAVLNMAHVSESDLPLNQDKTAAVLAELRRPTEDRCVKILQRVSADCATSQTSGISAFSQAPLSDLLV